MNKILKLIETKENVVISLEKQLMESKNIADQNIISNINQEINQLNNEILILADAVDKSSKTNESNYDPNAEQVLKDMKQYLHDNKNFIQEDHKKEAIEKEINLVDKLIKEQGLVQQPQQMEQQERGESFKRIKLSDLINPEKNDSIKDASTKKQTPIEYIDDLPQDYNPLDEID